MHYWSLNESQPDHSIVIPYNGPDITRASPNDHSLRLEVVIDDFVGELGCRSILNNSWSTSFIITNVEIFALSGNFPIDESLTANMSVRTSRPS